MKKNLLFIAFLTVISLSFKLQAQTYTYSKFNAAYTDLSSATVVSMPFWDDFSIYPKTIPFPFQFYGLNQDSLYIMGGFVAFHENGAGNFDAEQIYVFDASLTERSTGGPSIISTLLTGTAPNRIFKVETKNAGFADDASGNDYANVQLWLFEGTNVIEIHNGASSAAATTYSPLLGPTVGIYKDQFSFVALSGPAANPSASSTMASLNVTGTPTNGLVYRFSPSPAGLKEYSKNNGMVMYPNPTNGIINFKANTSISNGTLKVFNTIGQVVYEKNDLSLSEGQTQKLDLGLNSGIYYVQLFSQKGNFSPEKLIIK